MAERFARGRSAEVFRTADGKVMKLFFADYPRAYAEKEYRNTKIASELGCTPLQAVIKVILPEVMPGVISGALLSFTMSLDDFVISYFTSHTDQNLSMIIYSAARKGIEPSIYALSTLMFVAVLALLLIVNKRGSLEDVS